MRQLPVLCLLLMTVIEIRVLPLVHLLNKNTLGTYVRKSAKACLLPGTNKHADVPDMPAYLQYEIFHVKTLANPI